MRRINPSKAALALGCVIALSHLLWVALVSSGYAKAVMEFVLRLHFVQLDYQLGPFDALTGLTLVAITFVIGATLGFLFAVFWNWMAGSPPPKE